MGTGFDGGTGRCVQVFTTGQDGRGRFCRRDGTVRGYFLDGTGRKSATGDIFSPGRDGTS